MWKYAFVLVLGHYLFLKAESFPWALLLENCLNLGTDNVNRQIFTHILTPIRDFCLLIDIEEGEGLLNILSSSMGYPLVAAGWRWYPYHVIQGFQNKPETAGVLPATLYSTLFKIITCWLLMNFTQSLTFAESDAYFKTFSNPWLLVGIMWMSPRIC